MKFRKKTTTTLLIAIFMISALTLAVSASSGYFLTTNNGGIAEWSDERPLYGTHGIKLQVPITDPDEYSVGTYDEARVVFSYGDTLSSISSISYNSLVDDGMGGVYHPYVVIAVDTDADTYVDAWVVQLYYVPSGLDSWKFTTIDDDMIVHVAGTQPTTPPPSGSWTNQNPATATSTSQTIGTLKAEWGGKTVVEFKVMNGEIVFTEAVISFVDDVTINDVLYDFEPTSSTSMESVVRDPIISIMVDPTQMDFGIIVRGQDSDPVPVTVTNTGEISVDVTTTIIGTDFAFYELYLYTNGDLATVWTDTIGVSAYAELDLTLKPTLSASVGDFDATLIFWAEES